MTMSTLIPTNSLRVVVSKTGEFESRRLQQRVLNSVNGESIWIDIPEVLEEELSKNVE